MRTQNFTWLVALATALLASPVIAQDVQITSDMPRATFILNGVEMTISRTQDTAAMLTGEFAKTSRPCPDFCIQPMIASAGVSPAGELDVIDFLQNKVSNNTGLLVDARLPDWFAKGTIPGAVNIPFATLDPVNPYQSEILKALGAITTGDGYDFSNAMSLLIYGNGPWDAQGTRAVQSLVAAGYPAELIQNYRGGLEDWVHLGLTTVLP